MKYFITTVFTLLLFLPSAFSDTWIGGNGNWNDPTNWADGSVPTANDAVIISSGSVQIPSGYTAYASRVRMYNSSSLTINTGGGRLIVDASSSSSPSGIIIDGNLDVYGMLVVKNVHNSYSISIRNNSNFHVHTSAYLTVKNNTDTDGIHISPSGSFTNNGYVYIEDIVNAGIRNGGVFSNTSKIDILSTNSAIVTSQGTSDNTGLINVKGTNLGAIVALNNGLVVNGQNGNIITSYVESGVLVNSSNSTFENYGSIKAEWEIEKHGIKTVGTFINHEEGTISIDDVDIDGIETSTTGEFINHGDITIGNQIALFAIDNFHLFHNEACGVLTIHSPVYNRDTNDEILNDGTIYNYNTSGTSTNMGAFINDGAIEDNPGTLLPIVTNNEIIATALTGNVQVGVPVSNMLNLGIIDKYTIRGCYTSSALNASAGWYNMFTNQWTPNAASEGLTEVYLQIGYRINFTFLCSFIIKVEIPNGVQPFTSSSPFGQGTIATEEYIHKFLVYPNPFQQSLSLQIPADINGEHTLCIHNSMGSQVYKQSIIVEPGHFTLEDLSELASGTYLVSISKNGSTIWQDRIVKLH